MKQTQNQFYGKKSKTPSSLPPGSTFLAIDTGDLYFSRESGLLTPVSGGSSLGSDIKTLASTSGSTTWTGTESGIYSLTLSEDSTLENPTAPVAGQTYQLIVKQDSTGSHSLSYGDLFKFEGGTIPSIEISSNSISVLTFIYDGSSLLSVAVKNFL